MTDFLPNLSSPSDWPDTWKELQTIDSLLRCSICGEFFKNTTFIPSCSHNYCSLCIRRYLCVESKCPSCKVSVQDTHLENNRIIDEIVKSFVNIRENLLQLVKNSCNGMDKLQDKKMNKSKGVKKNEKNSKFFPAKEKAAFSRSQKRVRKNSSSTSEKSSSDNRWSPSDRKKQKRSSFLDDSSDSNEISIIENPTPKMSPSVSSLQTKDTFSKLQSKDENTVECPVCGVKIPAVKINIHLDLCLTSKDRRDNLRNSPMKNSQKTLEASTAVFGANSFIPQVSRRKPLNKLVYTLLSNTELKRKMKEHGLSIKGDRQTLEKRHQEFTVLYNSELSKPRPKSVPEIVRLLEDTERKKNNPVETRDKLHFERDQKQEDIDKIKDEYMSQNQSEFTRLINQIKNRKKKDASETEPTFDKMGLSPSTSSPRKLSRRVLPSNSESDSSADFEPSPKLVFTPRRRLRSLGKTTPPEKRRTRSSTRKLEKNDENTKKMETTKKKDKSVEDAYDNLCEISADETEIENDHNDPMESCINLNVLPDPPSPSLLDLDGNDSDPAHVKKKCFQFDLPNATGFLQESSDSESLLPPAFGK